MPRSHSSRASSKPPKPWILSNPPGATETGNATDIFDYHWSNSRFAVNGSRERGGQNDKKKPTPARVVLDFAPCVSTVGVVRNLGGDAEPE